MRRSAPVLAVLATALLLPATTSTAIPPRPPDDYRPVRGPSAPEEHRYLQKSMPGAGIPRHAYADAAAQAQRIPQIGKRWQSVGPNNIGGRIVGLALDPRRKDTLYAAAASGGLWKSTDAGLTYSTSWPETWTQAMGAVATAPDGTVFAGTGEPNPGGGSITYEGTGLYRSSDGGRSWRFSGLRDSGAISAITIDPRNPRRMFVAAAGSLYNGGGQRGVYRSLDGGHSWTKVLAGATEFTGATEVFFAGRNRLYAVMWDHRRQPQLRSYGGVGSGVFRSDDGGQTWRRLDSLAPVAPNLGRIGIGIAPTDPNRIYAIVGRGNTGSNVFDGFFVSTDGGDTWTRRPDNPDLAGSQSSYAWWFAKIWVDPNDADHAHVAGIGLFTTVNGGQTWTFDDETIHVDHHAMVWDPRYPARVYLGNDGGVYRSDLDGNGAWVKAQHQPWMQFYSATISPQDVSRYAGGTQDNGSLRSWGGPDFNEYVGGDGEENQINPRDKNNVFACYQYGNCFRSIDGGDNSTYFSNLLGSARRNWFMPIEFDPHNPNIMYTGGNQLNRSTDNGVTWSVISPDLTGGPGQDAYPFGTITTIGPAFDGRTVYVGTDDGRLWVTRDLGASWKLLLQGGVWVSRIAVSPSDPGRVWITRSGYRAGSPVPHVLASADFGVSWRDLSGNLPQAPVNDVLLGPGRALFLATDQGVFVSLLGRAQWLRLGRGLPMAPVDDIEYDRTNNRIVAATFGRGLYNLTLH